MKIFLKFLKFILSVILFVLIFEIYFQTSEIQVPSYVTDDTTFGRALVPNSRVTLIKESFNITSVNKYGYLGKPYPEEKRNNVLRIALIGDSFVEGIQVKDKHHFRSILEEELNNKSDSIIYEVLNFGRSGLDFRKMFIFYELMAKKYNPDIILIFVNESDFITNDGNIGPNLIFNNVKDSLIIDNSFNQSDHFKQKLKLRFLRNFSLYSLIQAANSNMRSDKVYKILFDKVYDLFNYNKKVGTLTEPDLFRTYLELNQKVLENFNKESHEEGISVYIIPIKPIPDQITDLIKKYKIQIFTLDDSYKILKEKGDNPFYWEATNLQGHWNQKAHFSIGSNLSKLILLKKPI